MPTWVKVILWLIVIVIALMIWNGQTTEAANVVGGFFGGVFHFFGNLGEFFGKLFS